MKHALSGIAALALLAGCSEMSSSDMNPMSWFGGASQPSASDSAPEPAAVIDTRELVPQVINIEAIQMSNGLVLIADGQPPAPGFWNPVLVPTNGEQPLDGFLIYEFRADGPTDAVVEGDESVPLRAARQISGNKLEGVVGIRVIAVTNNAIIEMARAQQ